MMTKKLHFETPAVLQAVDLSLEGTLLAGSIVDEALAITSTGQEVTDIDASSEDFDWNSQWTWE